MEDQDNFSLLAIQRFLEEIGIEVIFTSLTEDTFLPGLKIDRGKLLVDKSRLLYVGDLLHEAGHIALLEPGERLLRSGDLTGQENQEAIEMAVIAWSFAASLEAGIDPAVVFHNNGYHGGGKNILENFKDGRYFGVPILEWLGLTDRPSATGPEECFVYPKMRRWLRNAA